MSDSSLSLHDDSPDTALFLCLIMSFLLCISLECVLFQTDFSPHFLINLTKFFVSHFLTSIFVLLIYTKCRKIKLWIKQIRQLLYRWVFNFTSWWYEFMNCSAHMYCLHPYCLWYSAVQYIRPINTTCIRLYGLFSDTPCYGFEWLHWKGKQIHIIKCIWSWGLSPGPRHRVL